MARTFNILIVDDIVENLYSLDALLTEEIENIEVFQANSGIEALTFLRDNSVDLIILDIQMPEMDGFEVAKLIKGKKNTKDIPIVFLTAAFKSEAFKEQGFKIGAVDYLTKPIDENRLINKVNLYLKVFKKERELEIKNEELFCAKKKVTDSIKFSSMIQSSILPRDEEMTCLKSIDSFIIWQPKDIVSGDIYFVEEFDDGFLLFLIDCVGHGVAGAFMTMITKALIKNIVNRENCHNPARILQEFHTRIRTLLNQDKSDTLIDVGLDGAILYYKKDTKRVLFAGAKIPLFYIQDSELNILKGDRQSIGYKNSPTEYKFKNYEIELKSDTYFYLTTDGLIDQNGGNKDLPFGKSRFKSILLNNYKKSFDEQKEIILSELREYQGESDRNDDITIIGFKLGDKKRV